MSSLQPCNKAMTGPVSAVFPVVELNLFGIPHNMGENPVKTLFSVFLLLTYSSGVSPPPPHFTSSSYQHHPVGPYSCGVVLYHSVVVPLSASNGNFLLTQHTLSRRPSIQQFCRDPLKAEEKANWLGCAGRCVKLSVCVCVCVCVRVRARTLALDLERKEVKHQ